MSRRVWTWALGWLLAVALSGVAFAGQGMLLSSANAPADLQAQIEAARGARPEAFAAVRRIVEDAPRIAAQSRNRRAMLTPFLREVGADALWPLLEYVAFVSPDRSRFTDAQWLDAQCSLLEAAGMIRDARALPTFVAVLADPRQPAAVTRFAAEAVGRVGNDAAVEQLRTQLAAAAGERRTAILTGMGQCRRAAAARLLAAELARNPNEQTKRALVEALREVGNSWAWQTPVIAASGEGLETRRVATEALTAAFAPATDVEREAIAKALQVVAHPDAIALAQRARAQAGSAELRAAYDRLLRRLEDNPLLR